MSALPAGTYHRPFTCTTWRVTEDSHPFPARFPGVCAVFRRRFGIGEQGRMALVNGTKGFITQAGLRDLNVHSGAEFRDWYSCFSLDLEAMRTALADPTVARITVLDRYARPKVYRREDGHPGGWVTGIYDRCSVAQVIARTRATWAWMGERLATVEG